MRRNRVKLSSIICGLLFLAAGVLLFAFNTGLLLPEYKRVVFSLPMLLAAIGFVIIFSRHSWFLGVILILIGGFFLLPKLDIEGLGFITQNGWAIGLIILGILVICNAIWRRRFNHCHKSWEWTEKKSYHGHRSSCCGSYENGAGYIDRNCVFGGSKEKLNIKNFRGGDINSVFGGIELDLSEAQLAEGVHHLELNSVFGGIVLYVPVEWNIEVQQTQFFGNFVDNRPKPNFEVDEKRLLIIEANSVFGGGEIKCK